MYVRRKPRVRLEALIHGGGHERGMRSGILATHQIVGMGEAFRIANAEMSEAHKKVNKYHQEFIEKVKEISVYTTKVAGGDGAFRDAVDWIISEKGIKETVLKRMKDRILSL